MYYKIGSGFKTQPKAKPSLKPGFKQIFIKIFKWFKLKMQI
jgi:hypothetical protein